MGGPVRAFADASFLYERALVKLRERYEGRGAWAQGRRVAGPLDGRRGGGGEKRGSFGAGR
jgi:hypothetical protein